MKNLNNGDERVEFYNPNDIAIVKYKKMDTEDFDLFIVHRLFYRCSDTFEIGMCFNDLKTLKLQGLLNHNGYNRFYMDTVHYGEYFSNINIEYYIPLTKVYTLMEKIDILNKGYINSEDMKIALEYIINNYNEDRIMQKMEPKQRIRRK